MHRFSASRIRRALPAASCILLPVAVLSGVLHLFICAFPAFAGFFNRYPAAFVRALLAALTGWIPFSLAELAIILMPVIVAVLLFFGIRSALRSPAAARRYIAGLLSVLSLFYTLFVFTLAAGYRAPTLEENLGLNRHDVSAEELQDTALYLIGEVNALADSVMFEPSGASVMPYSLAEMNRKLDRAYAAVSEMYDFLPLMHTKVKSIVLSEPMTYTHISGVYSYFTGESNLNIHFPDYTLPATSAHEMSHQRGIAREDEANFMAFLVCMASDDTYIRYSGAQSLLEYVLNALYSADRTLYGDTIVTLDKRVRCEMIAYNTFFEKYRESAVSTVTEVVNDTYLKVQGQTAGTKSYGRVVDLAVAYYQEITPKN